MNSLVTEHKQMRLSCRVKFSAVPAIDFPLTDQSRYFTFRAKEGSGRDPKGLGTPANKPLMRMRSGNEPMRDLGILPGTLLASMWSEV